jgi:hypothetical protein
VAFSPAFTDRAEAQAAIDKQEELDKAHGARPDKVEHVIKEQTSHNGIKTYQAATRFRGPGATRHTWNRELTPEDWGKIEKYYADKFDAANTGGDTSKVSGALSWLSNMRAAKQAQKVGEANVDYQHQGALKTIRESMETAGSNTAPDFGKPNQWRQEGRDLKNLTGVDIKTDQAPSEVKQVYLNIRKPFDGDVGRIDFKDMPDDVQRRIAENRKRAIGLYRSHQVEAGEKSARRRHMADQWMQTMKSEGVPIDLLKNPEHIGKARQAIEDANNARHDSPPWARKVMDAFYALDGNEAGQMAWREHFAALRDAEQLQKESNEWAAAIKKYQLPSAEYHDIVSAYGHGGKAETQKLLAELGYDGITHIGGKVMGNKDHRVWIAFKPNQIKSVDNRGTFDAGSERIDYRKPAPFSKEGEATRYVAYARQWNEEDHPRGQPENAGQFVYHATNKAAAKDMEANGIDEDALNKRDSGFFGSGLYTSKEPQNFYGQSIVAIKLKDGSKVLDVGELKPNAPRPWQPEFLHSYARRILQHRPDMAADRLQEILAEVTPGSKTFNHISYAQELSRFARSEGYDAAAFANGQETVILKKDAVEHIKHLGGLKSAQRHRDENRQQYARHKPAKGQGSLSWGEEQEKLHPRGDDGRWIEKGELEAAKTDPKQAAMLRQRVTDPEQRKLLDEHIGEERPEQKLSQSERLAMGPMSNLDPQWFDGQKTANGQNVFDVQKQADGTYKVTTFNPKYPHLTSHVSTGKDARDTMNNIWRGGGGYSQERLKEIIENGLKADEGKDFELTKEGEAGKTKADEFEDSEKGKQKALLSGLDLPAGTQNLFDVDKQREEAEAPEAEEPRKISPKVQEIRRKIEEKRRLANESDQEKSWRELTENYNKVSENPPAADSLSLQRAMSWAQHMINHERRKVNKGGTPNEELVGSLEGEQEWYKTILKTRDHYAGHIEPGEGQPPNKGDLVTFTMPGINGPTKKAGTVTSLAPDGKIEVRLQHGGYHMADPKGLAVIRKETTPRQKAQEANRQVQEGGADLPTEPTVHDEQAPARSPGIERQVKDKLKNTWLAGYPDKGDHGRLSDAELSAELKRFPKLANDFTEQQKGEYSGLYRESLRRSLRKKVTTTNETAGKYAELEKAGAWPDGRQFPKAGETVHSVVPGLFGMPQAVSGIARRRKDGTWFVDLIGSSTGGNQRPALTAGWTVEGDPVAKQRHEERKAKAEKESAEKKAADEKAVAETKAWSAEHGLKADPKDSSKLANPGDLQPGDVVESPNGMRETIARVENGRPLAKDESGSEYTLGHVHLLRKVEGAEKAPPNQRGLPANPTAEEQPQAPQQPGRLPTIRRGDTIEMNGKPLKVYRITKGKRGGFLLSANEEGKENLAKPHEVLHTEWLRQNPEAWRHIPHE